MSQKTCLFYTPFNSTSDREGYVYMLRLMNFSVHSSDLEKFEGDYNKIKQFLRKNGLHGLELIQHSSWDAGDIPASMIVGLHMRFWPIWLDFWKEDKAELLRQFGDEDSYRHYYGGSTRSALIEHYRNELKTAIDMGAEYVVFHVSHVQLEHCYNYRFTYKDREVVEAFIEMLNEILEGMDAKFDLLLENLWWPGLTLTDKKIAARLMEGINYPNKGFMLDTGHLMNTNRELKTEEEAVEYMLKVLEKLDELSVYIEGIHLNSSLSGEYVKNEILRGGEYDPEEAFFNRYLKAFGHISKIDRHMPFTHPSVKKIIEFIKPQYLVYELLTDSLEELDEYVEVQNKALE